MQDTVNLLSDVSEDRLRQHVGYLAADPLPCRRLNYVVPGHSRCTLYEADDYIRDQLRAGGYAVEDEPVEVQAYRRDPAKPLAHQYSRPDPADPWYTANNIYARREGTAYPDEVLLVVAHKDSQSWLDCGPGAYDNATGTSAALEIAHVLADYPTHRSLWFLFCNEEHTPWTSITAAQKLAESHLKVHAVLNLDGVGGKGDEDIRAGNKACVTRFTTPEGEALADLMGTLNERHSIGLRHGKHRCDAPNDDDGSFVKAGIPPAVLIVGSFPYADSHYHTEEDTADRVDIANVRLTTQLALATILHIDRHGTLTVPQA